MAKKHSRSELVLEIGPGELVVQSFTIIFRNIRIFGPIIVVCGGLMALFGGTDLVLKETNGVIAIVIGLFLWLMTIFAVRQLRAKRKIGVRDVFYNSLTSLVAVIVAFVMLIIGLVPIVLIAISYAAAVQTELLAQPFYGALYIGFTILMVILSGYLLPSIVMTLVAVSAPGLYPLSALKATAKMMQGRKMKFWYRAIVLALITGMIFGVVLTPLAAMGLRQTELAVAVILLGAFAIMYAATYLFIYYRNILEGWHE